VLASQLWGYFGDKKDLSITEELAEDKKYWLSEHKLTTPIALDVQPPVRVWHDSTKWQPGPDRIGKALLVFERPTFVLIDENGMVRKYLPGRIDEIRLTAEINRLLRKKTKSATSP
jgi:hypothetical protein